MSNTAIIYWPKGGNTENVAKKIAEKFDDAKLFEVEELLADKSTLDQFSNIIAGCSTVGSDTWQDSMEFAWNVFFTSFKNNDFTNIKVALFGLGDQVLYPNHFVNDMSILFEKFSDLNAQIVGKWSTDGYEFTDSTAVENDHFYGLALDEDNEYELTDQRISKWTKILKENFNQKT